MSKSHTKVCTIKGVLFFSILELRDFTSGVKSLWGRVHYPSYVLRLARHTNLFVNRGSQLANLLIFSLSRRLEISTDVRSFKQDVYRETFRQ